MRALLSALRRALRRLGRRPAVELLPVLMRAVRADVPDASAEDLMDSLWLTLHMGAAQPVAQRWSWAWPRLTWKRPIKALPAATQAGDASSALESTPRRLADEPNVGLYLSGTPGQKTGLPFRTPSAPALPAKLALLRALRPLLRRVPSSMRWKLAERETAESIASTGNWEPCLVPETERWLRADLIVDRGDSMDLWLETARELAQLLQRYGAFSAVRVFSLQTQGAPQLFSGLGPLGERAPRSLALHDPTGRSVVLVLSDCISPAWHDGSAARCVERWGQRAPVALIQVLPTTLWPRTALGRAAPVWLQAGAPAMPTDKLAVRFQHRWMRFPAPYRAVPVMTLEISALRMWARMLAGAGGAWAPGVALGRMGQVSRPPARGEIPPKERLQRFRLAVTQPAWELARLLSAVPPFNLSVLRLVRQSMVPGAGQVHEAEVLLGGLLTVQKDAPNPEDIRYSYPSALREVLLGELRPADIAGVLDTVSDYITKNLGSVQDFQAILARPQDFQGADVLDQSPFARVTASVLARLGGPYAALAGIRGLEPQRNEKREKEHEERWYRYRIFVSYAYQDREYFQTLCDTLTPLIERVGIELLHEGAIKAGEHTRDAMSKMIDSSDVFLLLISADLLASDEFCEFELPQIRAACERKSAQIFPIYVHPTGDIEDLIPGLPPALLDRPISQHSDQHYAWSLVREQLDELLTKPRSTRKLPPITPARGQYIKVRLFIYYAPQDQDLAKRLRLYLQPMVRAELISIWSSSQIEDHTSWEINFRENQANIILLLMSADFLASEHFENDEFQRFFELNRRGEVRIVPIIARACIWESVPLLSDLSPLPKNGMPVTAWADRDAAWSEIVTNLRTLIMSVQISGGSFKTLESGLPISARSMARFAVSDSAIPVLIIAAPRERQFLNELLKHLSVFREIMEPVSDRDMLPGIEIAAARQQQLERAKIIVFLVSESLLAEEYIYIEKAQQLASLKSVPVVPVLVRECAWQKSSLSNFKCLPDSGTPIMAMAARDRDQAWVEIVKYLSAVARTYKPKRGQPPKG